MFLLQEPAARYSDPWHEALHERLNTLTRRSRRVLYLYEQADTSTFRYRAFNMQTVWNNGGTASSCYFFYHDLPYLLKHPPQVDVVVVCRARYTRELEEFVSQQRNLGARILYDVDDLVFSPPHVHLLLNTLAQDLRHPQVWDFWHAYTSRVREAMRLCDGAVTTNAFIADQITLSVGLPAVVVPNALNEQQLAISDRIYEEKLRGGFKRSDRFEIGYFSGTPSHEKDFDIVEQALANLLERYDNVALRVVGFLSDRPAFSRVMHRIDTYPLQDFVNLQRLIGQTELNIVPLQENVFTNCKSELKYFEAAVVGTATIATPIHSYAATIRHGETGLLANAHEWSEQIEMLIRSPERLIELAQNAHDHARKLYSPESQAEILERAILGDQSLAAAS